LPVTCFTVTSAENTSWPWHWPAKVTPVQNKDRDRELFESAPTLCDKMQRFGLSRFGVTTQSSIQKSPEKERSIVSPGGNSSSLTISIELSRVKGSIQFRRGTPAHPSHNITVHPVDSNPGTDGNTKKEGRQSTRSYLYRSTSHLRLWPAQFQAHVRVPGSSFEAHRSNTSTSSSPHKSTTDTSYRRHNGAIEDRIIAREEARAASCVPLSEPVAGGHPCPPMAPSSLRPRTGASAHLGRRAPSDRPGRKPSRPVVARPARNGPALRRSAPSGHRSGHPCPFALRGRSRPLAGLASMASARRLRPDAGYGPVGDTWLLSEDSWRGAAKAGVVSPPPGPPGTGYAGPGGRVARSGRPAKTAPRRCSLFCGTVVGEGRQQAAICTRAIRSNEGTSFTTALPTPCPAQSEADWSANLRSTRAQHLHPCSHCSNTPRTSVRTLAPPESFRQKAGVRRGEQTRRANKRPAVTTAGRIRNRRANLRRLPAAENGATRQVHAVADSVIRTCCLHSLQARCSRVAPLRSPEATKQLPLPCLLRGRAVFSEGQGL